MNYSWRFTKLYCYVHKDGWNNVVFEVDWNYIISDNNGNTAYISGTRGIKYYDGTAPFVPKDELTNEVISSWIEDCIPEEELISMKKKLDELLEEKVNPTVIAYDVYI